MKFTCYQQLPPVERSGEYRLNIRPVGSVEAHSDTHAIRLAKELPVFKYATGLARSPIVQEGAWN